MRSIRIFLVTGLLGLLASTSASADCEWDGSSEYLIVRDPYVEKLSFIDLNVSNPLGNGPVQVAIVGHDMVPTAEVCFSPLYSAQVWSPDIEVSNCDWMVQAGETLMTQIILSGNATRQFRITVTNLVGSAPCAPQVIAAGKYVTNFGGPGPFVTEERWHMRLEPIRD